MFVRFATKPSDSSPNPCHKSDYPLERLCTCALVMGRPAAVDYLLAATCAALVGLMLWFKRKKFVGSYLFFRATKRS